VSELAELSEHDRDEAVQLAHYVLEAVRDDLVFPLAIKDADARAEITRMSQYLLELADPSQDRSASQDRTLNVDAKFDTQEGE
jgi:hypothetical protein